MADKDETNTKGAPTATPRLEVKTVQLGGESIIDRLLPHMKKIVGALLVAAGVLAIAFFFLWMRDRKRGKETEKLAAVLEVSERPVRPADEKPDPKKPAPPSFASSTERANAVLDALVKQNTDLAGPTYRASMLMQAGKLDEAISDYRKAQSQSGVDGVLAREGLGLALEMKATQEKDANARQKGLEEALATFKSMQPDEKGPRAAYALYHQGRMLALLGKRDDAKAAFEKAKTLGKSTDLTERLDERLAGLGAS